MCILITFVYSDSKLSKLNLSYFIAKKIRKGKRFSSVVHSIAITSIALGLGISIVAFLIMHGFQTEVKDRMYKFCNHLLITQYETGNVVEETPLAFHQSLRDSLRQFAFVEHMQEVAHKAALVKTVDEVKGVVLRGVGKDFNLDYFSSFIKEGRFIHFKDTASTNEVVISRILSDKLKVNVGDLIVVHFFQNPPRYRKMQVVGIYETNLTEFFDDKMIISDINVVRLNGWDKEDAGGIEILLNKKVTWNQMRREEAKRYERLHNEPPNWLANIQTLSYLFFNREEAQIKTARAMLSENVDYNMAVESVQNKYSMVFDWLELINRQVVILLFIILIVISVNMISVVLILVMDRTPMVGLLKALGAGDGKIQSVFYWHAVSFIFRGLLLGNIIGLGVCFLQYSFRWIRLNPRDYYMDVVPIEWSWASVIFLNALIFVAVSLTLLIPSQLVMRLKPISAIRFD